MKAILKHVFKFFFALLVFCEVTTQSKAQEVNPQPLLDSVKAKFNKVKDYTADIKIKVDVDFIKIPIRQAKLYFKQPDKIKMKANGFALLPKRGLNFSGGDLLNKKYQAIFIKREVINKIPTVEVKIVPLEDNSDILLATMWIERDKQRIRRIDASTKSNGSFTINFDYAVPANEFSLPSRLSFDFDLNKMEIPAAISGDYNSDKPKEKSKGPSRGKIILDYANYSVNKGIPDSFFEEKKEQKVN